MFRFLCVCLVLGVGCVAGVAFLSEYTTLFKPEGPVKGVGTDDPAPKEEEEDTPEPGEKPSTPARQRDRARTARASSDDAKVKISRVVSLASDQPLIVYEARLQPSERQDVPSERDGKILCLATFPKKGEVVPKDKRVPLEFQALVTPVRGGELVKDEELVDVPGTTTRYRRVRDTDDLRPGSTRAVSVKLQLRKLEVNDWVEKDDLLAIVNPALAVEDLLVKHSKVEGSEAERKAIESQKLEYERRSAYMKGLVGAGVSKDEYMATRATWEKTKFEEVAKESQIRQAQRELSAALTTLKQHQIRAMISGKVKQLLKQPGEAIKNLENVLVIQNPRLLRVEGQVELQDALHLRKRLEDARRARETADKLRKGPNAREQEQQAQRWEQMADALLRVEVEASRPEPPRATLQGHLQEVTCVAVSRGPLTRIISGSEDETVRIWERVPGGDSWQQKVQLDHGAVVRVVACTGAKATGNRLLTGTVTGRGRLFDLDNPEKGETPLAKRHGGAILCAAFSPNGALCATGGEDRAVVVWDAQTGAEKVRIAGAHKAPVTSVQFTPDGKRLVTAGRDKRLVVWTLDADKATWAGELDRRSGDVPQLGVSPDGEHLLFDEGREIRVLSVKDRKIVGSLKNAGGAAAFSGMALYSPDGKVILTNGAAPGRLQLWRAPATGVRPAELRQLVWTRGTATCGAFAPDGAFAVTGTADHQVLVWDLPSRAEAEAPLTAQLSFVEEFLETSLRRVSVRADLKAPDWVLPGGTATMVIPPRRR